MQNVTKTKDEVGKEALKALEKNSGSGILAMATGTGKSKIAIDRIRELYERNSGNINVLIVVPTEKLRDTNWLEEFKKWDSIDLWNDTIVRSCYASITKMQNLAFDLVVLDECHNITPNNSTFFSNNRIKDIIGLTATYPKGREKLEIFKELGLKVIFEVTLDQAVQWGLVSPYNIIVVYSYLDNTKKYLKTSKGKLLTEEDYYWMLTKKINSLQVSGNQPDLLSALINKRMHFIYSLERKTEIAKFILDNLIPQDDRTLIFAGSTEQANKLSEHSFHYKTTDEHYQAFMDKTINRLSSVASLNEGQNIPDLDSAVIVQANSNNKDLVQRLGRIIRYRDNHTGNIYLVQIKGTVDEVWSNSALAALDNSKITYKNYSQLKLKYL